MPSFAKVGAFYWVMNIRKGIWNESAVSEVIGVILLLAVTVILAAIIAALAFGLVGSNLQRTKAVAVSVTPINTDIRCVYLGGSNDPELSQIAITAPNFTIFNTTSVSGALSTTGLPVRPNVGSVMILSGAATSGKDHVIVVGHFTDGAIQVLIDTYV